jgi:putative transposase
MLSPQPNKFKTCRRYNDSGHAHALNFCCFKNQKFLSKDRACGWLADAIDLARRKHEFDLWAYVFMPEHVHLLICPRLATYNISKVLATIKQSVTHKAVNYLSVQSPDFLKNLLDVQPNGKCAYRFWQRGGGFDRNIYETKALIAEIDYIHANPIRRGLCAKPSDWQWSSAADHELIRQGPLELDLESLPSVLRIER